MQCEFEYNQNIAFMIIVIVFYKYHILIIEANNDSSS